MLWSRSLPGWSVVTGVHHGRIELSVLILQPVTVQSIVDLIDLCVSFSTHLLALHYISEP